MAPIQSDSTDSHYALGGTLATISEGACYVCKIHPDYIVEVHPVLSKYSNGGAKARDSRSIRCNQYTVEDRAQTSCL